MNKIIKTFPKGGYLYKNSNSVIFLRSGYSKPSELDLEDIEFEIDSSYIKSNTKGYFLEFEHWYGFYKTQLNKKYNVQVLKQFNKLFDFKGIGTSINLYDLEHEGISKMNLSVKYERKTNLTPELDKLVSKTKLFGSDRSTYPEIRRKFNHLEIKEIEIYKELILKYNYDLINDEFDALRKGIHTYCFLIGQGLKYQDRIQSFEKKVRGQYEFLDSFRGYKIEDCVEAYDVGDRSFWDYNEKTTMYPKEIVELYVDEKRNESYNVLKNEEKYQGLDVKYLNRLIKRNWSDYVKVE